MKLSIKYILTLTLLMLLSCGDAQETEYTIKIIAYKGSFNAWYTINGGDYNFVTQSDTQRSGQYYSYTKSFNDQSLDYLKIHADAEGDSVTYIEVEVYKEDDRVASNSKSQGDPDETISITCIYNPELESNDND